MDAADEPTEDTESSEPPQLLHLYISNMGEVYIFKDGTGTVQPAMKDHKDLDIGQEEANKLDKILGDYFSHNSGACGRDELTYTREGGGTVSTCLSFGDPPKGLEKAVHILKSATRYLLLE